MDDPTPRAQLVSVLPGRVRVRLNSRHRGQLRSVEKHLASQPGVDQVSINPRTGSILVHGSRRAVSSEDVIAMLRDLGIFVAGIEEATDPISLLTRGDVAEGVASSVDDLGHRLSDVVGLDLDVKVIAPVAVGALGLRQLIVEGLGQVSGYLLLWVAFDLYYKFHHGFSSRRQPDEESPPSGSVQVA